MAAKQQSAEQGYVLLLAAIILAGLGSLVPLLIQSSSTERIISSNYRCQIENYYLVEGVTNKAEHRVKKELQELKQELSAPLQQRKIGGGYFSEVNLTFVSIKNNKLTVTAQVEQVIIEDSKVNLNTVSQEELKNLPGVGQVLSRRIIANCSYQCLEELKAVSGLGPNRYNQLTQLVTVVGGGKVNLNSASLEVLTALAPINSTLAQRIVSCRPFEQAADLQQVAGVGPAVYQQLKDKIKVKAEYFTVYFKIRIPARNFTGQRKVTIKF